MDHKATIRAIREINGVPSDFIPLHAPVFRGNELKYVTESIQSTFVSSVGKFVDEVEKWVARETHTSKAVAMVNGTAALHISLLLAGVQRDEEVLTQALTFVATANTIHYLHAHPVFLDVDRDTLGLSPSAVESFLEEFGERRGADVYNKSTGRRIAAILPMHTFGFMVHMDEMLRVSEKWGIPLVEDAAEAYGCEYKGKPAGTMGVVGAYSFNGNKVITSGGGGILVSKNEEIATHAKYITTTAKVPHPWEYVHDETGFNYRMPNLNAALLLAQMEVCDDLIKEKQLLFERYAEYFSKVGIQLLSPPETTTRWNYWLMAIQTENRAERDALLEATNEAGVMTRPIWKLMSELPMYKDCQTDSLTNSVFLEDRIVNIPSGVKG
ncbi:MAG: LegC family aminotransferase [Bacteroidetes bacterium]|nr:MAG: LegC family aminotransferase [Bacteroidota bacterium]